MPGAGAPRPAIRCCGAPAITERGHSCKWPLSSGACPRHHDADPEGRCTALLRPSGGTKRPDRCRAWPLKGSPVCLAHSPEEIAARRAARQQKRADALRRAKLERLAPVRDLLALFLEMLDAELERPGTGGPVLSRYLRTI